MGDTTSTMMSTTALEPLFAPWDEPNAHRRKADTPGQPAIVMKGRRPTAIILANNLRSAVREWRETYYTGASETTRQLLAHWFERPHHKTKPDGTDNEFRYYFCQREAIETAIYLKEVRQFRCLSQVVEEFGGPDATTAALGITEDEDAWTRLAFKLATGAGKTKVMSLAIVWSYFHALRESESPMAKHFVIVAPNLTVYERLKDDFADGRIFHEDPLIPSEWQGDWNMSVVLQDAASGAATGGVIYLTNIHRLYDSRQRKGKKEAETYSWMGPPVSKSTALDTGAALRDRITSHDRIMVLNDEAHHLWDPGSAWNEAVKWLHDTLAARSGGEIAAQLDFTATPKDNRGQVFKHVVCDTPLGEAVDGGIVKTPIIGRADAALAEEPNDNAAYRFDRHLRLGYTRWLKSRDEWAASGKKALLFVMCEDTTAADEIAKRLDTDETFKELNGKTINLHTNLKGVVKKVGKGPNARVEFVENEKEISDEDLKALRALSRALDDNSSHYLCVVSVLMLREGWDVQNVTCIVPLRPYSSKANILPEQTLGRGLRRMTPPGTQGANEVLSVVDHPAFASLYQNELAQEGLPIEVVDVDRIPTTTVSIYPDTKRKDIGPLDIGIPVLSEAHRTIPKLEKLEFEEVKKASARYKRLPIGHKGDDVVDYEGRHLITDEIVERMKIHLPLLNNGAGAVSYYVKQLEHICRVRSLHGVVAPLLQSYIEELLFEQRTSLYDTATVARLGDSDVTEHIRAVFVPLIRARTTTVEERIARGASQQVSAWKPYQATHNERRPALGAAKTLFNLVPCNRSMEVAMVSFAEKASDVAAFAKNAGPQCLRIDYLSTGGRLAFYTPDFFIRTAKGECYLVETKGREDLDVPRKARAAVAWCESASTAESPWHYLYIPEGIFERQTADKVEDLARACEPHLQNLLTAEDSEAEVPLLALLARDEEKATGTEGFVEQSLVDKLPPRYREAVNQAVMLLKFFEKKENVNLAPAFTSLLGSLDDAARALITGRLIEEMPATVPDQKAWFTPYLADVDNRTHRHYEGICQNLKRTLVFRNGLSPLGLLRSCLDYAMNDRVELGGVFTALRNAFKTKESPALLKIVDTVYDFRNKYVAHHEEQLTDYARAENMLKEWIRCLAAIHGAER